MPCSRGLLANLIFSLVLTALTTEAATPELLGIIRSDSAGVLFADFMTAVGDQNGDGCSDLLVSTGRPFNYLYRGGQAFDTMPWLVFDSTNPWHSAVGDVNGDGWTDFAMQGRSQQRFKMGLYLGGPDLDTIRDYWFGWDSSYGGTFAAAVDLDVDGQKEVITVVQSRYKALVFDLAPWDSLPWLTLPTLNRKGSFAYEPAVGDFNGDGHDDLALGLQMRDDTTMANGRVYIYFASASFDTLPDLIIIRPDDWVYGYQMFGGLVCAPGDLNGDGYDDLLATSGAGGGDPLHFVYYGGPGFDDVPDLILTDEFSEAAAGGDLNSDGWADLLVSNPSPWSGYGWVYAYFGGPAFDSLPDIRLYINDYPHYHTFFGRDVVGLGDFNGDGVDDFAFSMYDIDVVGLIYIYSGFANTDVPDEEGPDNLPTGCELHQNYPNPFNATTAIAFDLPSRSAVTLQVFNITGEAVTTLVQQTLSAGSYRVAWDGTNDSGKPAASGVYFYRLEAGGVVQAKKMLLLK